MTHAQRPACGARGRWSAIPAAAFAVTLLGAVCERASAAEWSCYGAKPGHPTAAERERFVREVSALAVRAERRHGVPASALAAIAIAESNYGWTRAALYANNPFGWKATRAAAKTGRAYVAPCARRGGTAFRKFSSRDAAFEHVAGRLATIAAYRTHTEAYRERRKRGADPAAAVDAWIAGIAPRYAGDAQAFVDKLTRVMNDPLEPSDTRSAETTLYRLSADPAAPTNEVRR